MNNQIPNHKQSKLRKIQLKISQKKYKTQFNKKNHPFKFNLSKDKNKELLRNKTNKIKDKALKSRIISPTS